MTEAKQNSAPMVEFIVDGKKCSAPRESSLLDFLLANGYDIPYLCHNPAVKPYGACRLCLVEVKSGRKTKLTTSCNYPILEGIEVFTNTEKVRRNRKMVMQLLLARAPESEELRKMAKERFGIEVDKLPFDKEKGNKCILCGLCVRVCREVVGIEALSFAGRGEHKEAISPFHDVASTCIGCGACAIACPTNCIGLDQVITKRSLARWNRELPMKTCKRCGYAYAPMFQLEHFQNISSVPADFFDLCPDCRK